MRDSSATTASAGLDLTPRHATERWFTDEIRSLEPALRAHLQRRFPTLADADDVVQESLLRTFLAWQRGRLTSVRGFRVTVAGNATPSLFRRRRPFVPLPPCGLPPAEAPADPAGVVRDVGRREEFALVAAALDTRPDRDREVAIGRLLKGQEDRVIPAGPGITEATMRGQHSRARRRGARHFRERDGAPGGPR